MNKDEAVRIFERSMTIRRLSSGTVQNYLYYVKQMIDFIGKSELSDLDADDALNFTEHLIDEGCASSTVNLAVCAVRYFYEVALDTQLSRRKFPNIQYYHEDYMTFTQDQIKQMIDKADIQMKAFILLGFDCGLRISEVARLKFTDVHSKEGTITIYNSKRKKTRKVKLSQAVYDALADYYRLYQPKEYFFEGRKSAHMVPGTIGKKFRDFIQMFDFYEPRMTFHSLRHTFATNMVLNGCDIFTLQQLLGHSSLSSSAHYYHMSGIQIQSAISLSDVWGIR